MRSRAVISRALIAPLLLATVGGCVPIPYVIPPLGYTPDSRHNLSDRVPAFIVEGQTSREEVLYALGEPDNLAADDETFIYVSANRRGGVGSLLIPAVPGASELPAINSQRTLYHRLIVHFDAAGRVSSTVSETKTCWSKSSMTDVVPLNSKDNDPLSLFASDRCLAVIDGAAPAPAQNSNGRAPVHTFGSVWVNANSIDCRTTTKELGNRPLGATHELILTSTELILAGERKQEVLLGVVQPVAEPWTLPLADIDSSALAGGVWTLARVALRLKNGSCTFLVFGGFPSATSRAKEFLSLLDHQRGLRAP